MISGIVTDPKTGEPLDGTGQKLSVSSYSPPEQVIKLFSRVQSDFLRSWRLQHRPFREFDGFSLLERTLKDQQTFGAYVGAVQEPKHKQWRWKGRKNTARNKVIGILAHVISGMLFPYCYAYNNEDEEDKLTAQVMRILIEDHLKKANYELKFLFMMTSALVNPAVLVEVEYVEAMQRIKQRLSDGSYKIVEAVDELLSGINLNLIPIDQLLLADFFTFDLQRQPNLIRVRRISWDEARKIYSGKHFIDGVDQFDFVQAGKTRVLMAGQEHQVLYDIEWTEADANYVQEITAYYRPEDLQVTFVGGVFMGDEKDIYNSNPFEHRRMTCINDEWLSIPVYPFAKTGFEPLDPNGRFAYYKSACFKEFWDAAAQDRMHQLAYDGTYLDVIKPIFMQGLAKIDGTVMVPGATIGMPLGSSVTPYSLGPNVISALQMMKTEQEDLSESTQDKIMSGVTSTGITAYATAKAEQNAKTIMGVFSIMIVDLIKQIGELTMDCVIQHETVGDVDDSVPEALQVKYKKFLIRGKEGGKDITQKIEFTTPVKELSKEDARKLEWDMFDKAGGIDSDQRNYKVNPYKFARHKFSLYIDPDQITSKSMGTDQLKKDRAFQMLTNPMVLPFVDLEAVANKFVIEEYSEGDPDEFKKKGDNNAMLDQIMPQINAGAGVGFPQNNMQMQQ